MSGAVFLPRFVPAKAPGFSFYVGDLVKFGVHRGPTEFGLPVGVTETAETLHRDCTRKSNTQVEIVRRLSLGVWTSTNSSTINNLAKSFNQDITYRNHNGSQVGKAGIYHPTFVNPNVIHSHGHQTGEMVPWIVFVSLGCILACASAAVGIVPASNNQTVDSWAIQPAVLLAIISSILDLAVISAMTPGLEVRFWLRAGKGTTLAQLHHIWNAKGIGIFGAFQAGSESRRVAILSAIIYIAQFANGPLLQRSTYQVGRTSTAIVPLSLDLAPNFPEDFTTRDGGNDAETMDAHRKWIMVTQNWWQNTTLMTKDADGYVCNGTCTGNVPGVGITHQCSSSTSYLDYTLPSTDGKLVFAIDSLLMANETGGAFLAINISYVSDIDESCMATVTTENCNVTAVLVEYPVTVQNRTVSLRRSELFNMTALTAYSVPGDSPTAPENTTGGALASLNKFVWAKLSDDARSRHRNPDRTYNSDGWLADIFYVANESSYSPHVRRECGLKWVSPTEYVLLSLHDFMFRAALEAGAETGATQAFTVHRRGFELIFRSNESYLAVAVTAIGISALFLVVLVWG